MPTIHQLKPAISPKLSAAEWLPEVLLLWGCLENEHLGRPELLIGGGNDIKCHNAPFQIKTCPDFSGRGGRGENGPKYLRNDCIFLSLNSYYILPGKLVTSKVSSPSRCCLESSIRHSWPVVFILHSTRNRGQTGTASVPMRRAHGYKVLVTVCHGEEGWGSHLPLFDA